MRLSFHDEKSLEEVVGSLRFAPGPSKPNLDKGSNDIIDQERSGDDIGIRQVNDVEIVDRGTLKLKF